MLKMNSSVNKHQNLKISNIKIVSPHNKAIYELGKSMLLDSINTGREFCKFMISISIGAIPVYLGILTFLLPKDYNLGLEMSLIILLPPIFFLLSVIVFTISYFPIISNFSLDIIEEIEKVREVTIKRRIKRIKIGFSIFLIASLLSIVVIIFNLGLRQ